MGLTSYSTSTSRPQTRNLESEADDSQSSVTETMSTPIFYGNIYEAGREARKERAGTEGEKVRGDGGQRRYF